MAVAFCPGQWAAMSVRTIGQLACTATLSRNHEELCVRRFQNTFTVALIISFFNNNRRLGPLRAFGFSWLFYAFSKGRRFRFNRHGKCQLSIVVRPTNAARTLAYVSDFSGALFFNPVHMNLVLFRAIRRKGKTSAVV